MSRLAGRVLRELGAKLVLEQAGRGGRTVYGACCPLVSLAGEELTGALVTTRRIKLQCVDPVEETLPVPPSCVLPAFH
jgi:hypothetical protein